MDNKLAKELDFAQLVADQYNAKRWFFFGRIAVNDVHTILFKGVPGDDFAVLRPHVNVSEIIAIAKAVCAVADVVCPIVAGL